MARFIFLLLLFIKICIYSKRLVTLQRFFWFMDITVSNIGVIPTHKIVNNTGQVPDVPANPRTITKSEYEALKKRMRENNLLGMFPLKVFYYCGEWIAMGGNQRLRAAKELKFDTVSCIIIPPEADAKTLREIVTLENTHDGVFDWDMLANEWDAEEIASWGVKAGEWGREDEESKKSGDDSEQSKRKKGILICCNKGDTMFIGGKVFECGDEIELNEFLELIGRN